MNHALRTIAYFLIWGTFYGLVLGAWSGTAIFPAIGTAFAASWGIGIGAACGLLAGLVTALIQAYTFHPDVDLDRFRRRLSLGIGILTPIAATIMLMATSRGLLWSTTVSTDVRDQPALAFFLPFCLAAVLIWGSLSSAYVANAYPEWLVQLKTGARMPLIAFPSFRYSVPRATWLLMRRCVNWGTLILGGIGGMLYQEILGSPYSTTFYLGDSLKFTAAGLVVAPIYTLLICFGNAALLTFLKKTVFAEDALAVSPRKLRWILTIITLVFTGITSAWMLIFAPLAALLMAQYVYDSFPLFDEDIDKAKRKEKNALALEETHEEDDHLTEETDEQSGRLMQRA
jgi:hypothetical protein